MVERDQTAIWRWTNGRGLLPVDSTSGPMILDIQIGATTRYRRDIPRREAA